MQHLSQQTYRVLIHHLLSLLRWAALCSSHLPTTDVLSKTDTSPHPAQHLLLVIQHNELLNSRRFPGTAERSIHTELKIPAICFGVQSTYGSLLKVGDVLSTTGLKPI